MEFHNALLLPKGLPEIMSAVTPYEFSPWTKVVAFSRKNENGNLGMARFNRMTFCFEIYLYPTLCCSNGGRRPDVGTPSFKLWMALLQTALHEIGHLATRDDYIYLDRDHNSYSDVYLYVERLANNWMRDILGRILRDNPRLGQPAGALTGYPGMLVYRLRNSGRPWNGSVADYARVNEWRALGCGGQVTMFDIACKLKPGLYSPPCDLKQRARIYRLIHQAAEAIGVRRFFVNRNGRRYLMFNADEADAVWNWLNANVEAVDRAVGKDDISQSRDRELFNLNSSEEQFEPEQCPF